MNLSSGRKVEKWGGEAGLGQNELEPNCFEEEIAGCENPVRLDPDQIVDVTDGVPRERQAEGEPAMAC